MKTVRRVVVSTEIDIVVWLTNGVRVSYGWETPISIGRANMKALAWAKENMKRKGVRGRSNIESFTVTARRVVRDAASS